MEMLYKFYIANLIDKIIQSVNLYICQNYYLANISYHVCPYYPVIWYLKFGLLGLQIEMFFYFWLVAVEFDSAKLEAYLNLFFLFKLCLLDLNTLEPWNIISFYSCYPSMKFTTSLSYASIGGKTKCCGFLYQSCNSRQIV